jgi:hypothetical protein
MELHETWLGTVWSFRTGRTLIGKITAVTGDFATLDVVGLTNPPPCGINVLPPGNDGACRVLVDLQSLVDRWKRMGPAVG